MANESTETKTEKKGKDKEAKKAADAAPTTAITPVPGVSDALALSTLSDADLLKVAEAQGSTYEELWTPITDKKVLVGRPFVILEVEFRSDGNFGPYTTIRGKVLDAPGRPGYRFVMSDGSKGINEQLRGMAAAAPDGKLKLPMPCFKGLRDSSYTYTDPNTGEEKPATTYRIDGSKD